MFGGSILNKTKLLKTYSGEGFLRSHSSVVSLELLLKRDGGLDVPNVGIS